MKINIGEYEVYETGSLLAVKSHPVEFFFPNFSVKVEFVNTEDKSDIQMNFSLENDSKQLKISLKNFSNSLGTENLEPINVGKINSRDLLLQFRVYAMDKGDTKLLHYTWLLGKEVENG